MVQSQVVCSTVSTTCHQKPREATKTVKNPKNSSKSKTSKDSQHSAAKPASLVQKKDNEVTKPSETEKETQEETAVVFIPLVEEIKQRRREERLAKEKQAEEERERFVKEATERKAAERAEIVKQAKRLILYRKPFCRKINQALLVSECFRELDAQLKFRETVRNMDKEQEMAYVKLMRADVAKFEEEEKQKAEKQLKKQMNYADTLKKQIEEHQRSTETQEKEEFEAEKQDQINTDKYLQDMKEHEMQEVRIYYILINNIYLH
ncbi:uncharacterized protein LOC143179607 [Calliopsis andreniformis]|uniref:uncharacterized protein LOC143179607 n=1 Tax=Calliopsis andreniformis TaxID=337506 RepID=UPI003FCE1E5D